MLIRFLAGGTYERPKWHSNVRRNGHLGKLQSVDDLPSEKTPVLHIHGTADALVPYSGSLGMVSVDELLTYWATHNGCDLATDTVKILNTNIFDQCTAERIDWLNCDGNTEVILYRVINGEHTWSGAPVLIGVTNRDFSASEIIWQFFNQSLVKPTGMDNPRGNSPIQVYPNPAGDYITINGSGKMVSGSLFDLNESNSFPPQHLPFPSKSIFSIFHRGSTSCV